MSETDPLGLGTPEMRFPPLREWIEQRDLAIVIGSGQNLSMLPMPVIRVDADSQNPGAVPLTMSISSG